MGVNKWWENVGFTHKVVVGKIFAQSFAVEIH